MSHFRVYVDRENSSQMSTLQTPLASGLRTVPVGKTFNGNQAVPMLPRKALRDVRNQQMFSSDVVHSNVKRRMKEQGRCEPVALLNCFSQVQKSKSREKKQDVKVVSENIQLKPKNYEPIERMIVYNEELEDDFEDLWPYRERPTTYLRQIENCRPPVFATASPPSPSNDCLSDEEFVPERECGSCLIERAPSTEELVIGMPSFLEEEILFLELDD